MTRNEEARSVARSYLLRQMAGESREQFEATLFADDALFAGVLEFEDELMEDYASNKLDPKTREQFEAIYINERAGHKHYRLHRTLTHRAGSKPAATQTKHDRIALLASVAVAVIAVSALLFLLIERFQLKQEITELRTAHNQAMKRLNEENASDHVTAGRTNESPATQFVALNRYNFRQDHGSGLQTVFLNENTKLLVLLLEITVENPQGLTFIAAINTPEGNHLYQSGPLNVAPSTGEKSFVYFSVPVTQLAPGDYIVALTEHNRDTNQAPAGEFAVRILKKRK